MKDTCCGELKLIFTNPPEDEKKSVVVAWKVYFPRQIHQSLTVVVVVVVVGIIVAAGKV